MVHGFTMMELGTCNLSGLFQSTEKIRRFKENRKRIQIFVNNYVLETFRETKCQ